MIAMRGARTRREGQCLNERYVREWLGALVTGGIAAYDPASATYNLPPAAAACLTVVVPFQRQHSQSSASC
jgi:hypothetical protein